jgi:hypothetical protein
MEDNEKEWKTINWNGRQQTGMGDNGMMESETDARCSASISNIWPPQDIANAYVHGSLNSD